MQNVLIRLTEEWRRNIETNYSTGAALMDLSKTFDCTPHHLVIVKITAY